jgi:hypothetical protein
MIHLHPSYNLTINEFVTFNSILDPLPPNGGSKTQFVNSLLADKLSNIRLLIPTYISENKPFAIISRKIKTHVNASFRIIKVLENRQYDI